jgi:hypothetical protein
LFYFRQGEEVACTIQGAPDHAGGLFSGYTGATANALFSAQLPIPIKLCKFYKKFYLNSSEQKLRSAYENSRSCSGSLPSDSKALWWRWRRMRIARRLCRTLLHMSLPDIFIHF